MTARKAVKKKPVKAKAKEAHVFDRADYEWYVDTPSVSAALFSVESFDGAIIDPCAGMGNIPRMAIRAGYSARAYDINPRPKHYRGLVGVLDPKPQDFFSLEDAVFDSIVFNPPYGYSKKKIVDGKLVDDTTSPRFEEMAIERALTIARYKVAAVVRLQWLVPRMTWLKRLGLIRVWLISPRPSMLPGENILAGEMPGGGGVDYAWLVFIRGADISPTIGEAKRINALDSADNWSWRLGKNG